MKPVKLLISLLAGLLFSCMLVAAVSATVWNPSLPTKAVTAEIINLTPMEMPLSVQLSNVDSGFDVANRVYTSWCVDIKHWIDRGVKYNFTLYSSYNDAAPLPDEEWDMINYILNNKLGAGADVQAAIYYFINDREYYWSTSPFTPSNETQIMVANALASGSGYIPSEGELLAVVGVPADETPVQTIVLEVTVPDQAEPEPTPETTPNPGATPTPNPGATPSPEPEATPEPELTPSPTPTPSSILEGFPVTLVASAALIAAVVAIGLIIYSKERSRRRSKTTKQYFQNIGE